MRVFALAVVAVMTMGLLTGARVEDRQEAGAMCCKSKMRALSANYAVVARDYGVLMNATGGDRTVTLRPAEDVKGEAFLIAKTDGSANPVLIVVNGGDLINGDATAFLLAQWDAVVVRSDGSKYVKESWAMASVIAALGQLTASNALAHRTVHSAANASAWVTSTNTDADHAVTLVGPVDPLTTEAILANDGDSLLLRFSGKSSLNSNLKGVGLQLYHNGAFVSSVGVGATDNFTLGAGGEMRITRAGTVGDVTTFVVTGFVNRVSSAAAVTYTPLTVTSFSITDFDPATLSLLGYGFCETSGTVQLNLVQAEHIPAQAE